MSIPRWLLLSLGGVELMVSARASGGAEGGRLYTSAEEEGFQWVVGVVVDVGWWSDEGRGS